MSVLFILHIHVTLHLCYLSVSCSDSTNDAECLTTQYKGSIMIISDQQAVVYSTKNADRII